MKNLGFHISSFRVSILDVCQRGVSQAPINCKIGEMFVRDCCRIIGLRDKRDVHKVTLVHVYQRTLDFPLSVQVLRSPL
jgi:hypothetical protein